MSTREHLRTARSKGGGSKVVSTREQLRARSKVVSRFLLGNSLEQLGLRGN